MQRKASGLDVAGPQVTASQRTHSFDSGNLQLTDAACWRSLTDNLKTRFRVMAGPGHQVFAEWGPGGDRSVGAGNWIDEWAG
jgi:hypothetical protein